MSKKRVLIILDTLLLIIAVAIGILSISAMLHANVIVEWSTASELDTAGFNLFRKDSPDGSATQVNSTLIPASVDPLIGGAYHYQDNHVEPGRTYYYELEEVQVNGNTSRFGPIEVKAVRSGVTELIISLGLVILALVSLGVLILSRPRVSSKHESQTENENNPSQDVYNPGDSINLSIGRIRISLACNDRVLSEALRQRYKAFQLLDSQGGAQFLISVEVQQPISIELAEPFNPQAFFQDGSWRLDAPGCKGTIDEVAGRGQLELSSPNSAEAVDYFVRAFIALLAFRSGGLLIHAAGIVRQGQTYLFFGHSGSGKTTVARNSVNDLVLNDDLLVLFLDSSGWQAYATPFWNPGQVQPVPGGAPMVGLYRLVQDTQVFLEPMSKAQALAELVSNIPIIPDDPAKGKVLLERLQKLLESVPVWRLHFLPDASFWNFITETM
jgi:hypothetical protein